MNRIKNAIKTYPFVTLWVTPMFTYGFTRQWNVNHEDPFKLLSFRLLLSMGNGFMYSSPLGLFSLLNLTNRTEIYITNKNKDIYKDQYKELIGYNFNTIL